jgi:hypothetical protein
MFAKLHEEFTARGCGLLGICNAESMESEKCAKERASGCSIDATPFLQLTPLKVGLEMLRKRKAVKLRFQS